MKEKFMRVVRTVEVSLLKFFIAIYKGVVKGCMYIKRTVGPKWKPVAKTAGLAIVSLYIIGAIVFGIRLYKQNRFEKVDLVASYIYPFPVANSGRALVFDKQLQQWVSASKKFATENGVETPTDLGQKILQELADYQIAAQEANALNVKLTSKDINEKFDLSIEGIGTRDQAVEYIKQMYGLSLNQFKRMITPMILTEKVREDKFAAVKVRHILIADENKAKDIAKQAKEGGNFEELAKQNSEDQSSKDQGGLLAGGEFIYRDSGLVAEFEDAMMKLKAGEVSDPVKTDYGYHIIKVDERKGEIDVSYTNWIESLKNKYPERLWI